MKIIRPQVHDSALEIKERRNIVIHINLLSKHLNYSISIKTLFLYFNQSRTILP